MLLYSQSAQPFSSQIFYLFVWQHNYRLWPRRHFFRLVIPGGQRWDTRSTCGRHGVLSLLIPQRTGCLLLFWLCSLFSPGVARHRFTFNPSNTSRFPGLHQPQLRPVSLNTWWMHLEPFSGSSKPHKHTWVCICVCVCVKTCKDGKEKMKSSLYFQSKSIHNAGVWILIIRISS